MFVIGDDKKAFHVSQEAIAGLSPTLQTLIKNDAFDEAKAGKTVWDDVDVHTFTRLCQFAYFGDYLQPQASEDPALTSTDGTCSANTVGNSPATRTNGTPQPSQSLQLEQNMIWESLAPTSTKAQPKDTPEKSRSAVGRPMVPAQDSSGLYHYGCPSCRDTSSGCGYCYQCGPGRGYFLVDSEPARKGARGDLETAVLAGDVFPGFQSTGAKPAAYADLEDGKAASFRITLFAHAKLYVLGDKWDIISLKALSSQKLQKVLEREVFSEASIEPVLEVARFVFENTTLDQDNIRGLIIHYLVATINALDLG